MEAVFEYDDYSILSDTYSYDGWYIFGTIDPGKKMNLSWHPLPEGEYAYAFEFKDIYGALYQTDWIIYDHSLIGVTLEPESAHLEHLNGTEYGEGFIYP